MRYGRRLTCVAVLGAGALVACSHMFAITVLGSSTPSRVTVRLAVPNRPSESLLSLWFVTVDSGCGTSLGTTLWSIRRAARNYPAPLRPLDVTLGVVPDSSWRPTGALPAPLRQGCYVVRADMVGASARTRFVVTGDGRIESRA